MSADVLMCAALLGLAVCAWPGRVVTRAADRMGQLTDLTRLPELGSAGEWGSSPWWSGLARWSGRLAGRRAQQPIEGLSPDLVMDLIACGLRGGLAVTEALGCAADASHPVGASARTPYLVEVVARLRVGVPAQRAWARPPPEYAALARAMLLADLSGAPAAAVVARAAQDARAARREQVERAAARLGVRLVLPLGLAVLPGFVLLAVVPIVLGLASSVLGLGL